MKKFLSLLLVCSLVIALFTACKKETTEATTTDTTETAATTETATATETTTDTPATAADVKLVVSWWGNQTRNERTQALLDLYTSQNPNVTFDGQFAEWADYWNKLATASAGHSLPDVIQMDYKYLQQYVGNDLLVDLTPYVDNKTLDLSSVDSGIVQAGSVDGGIYAVCIGVNAPALLYNKTLLEANNIAIKDNMTMDEFIALSREIYEKTGYKTNIAYNNGDNFIEYLLRGQGIALFENGKLGAASAEDYLPFFQIYETGIKEGWHVDPSVFAEITIGSVEQDPMVYGNDPSVQSWCTFAYSNQLTAVQNAAPEGTTIGITTWPSADPKASNYLKPGQFLSVSKDSANPEEATKILNFFTNSVEANDILLGERGVPASSVVAEAISGKIDEQAKQVTAYINNVVTPNSSPINAPAPDGASEVFDLIDKIEEQLCYGVIDASEAAQQLFEEGNKIFESK